MKEDNTRIDEPWYGAKCVFLHHAAPLQGDGEVYEERIVLVRAATPTEAIERGEAEAREYAASNDAEYLGFINTYHMFAGVKPILS